MEKGQATIETLEKLRKRALSKKIEPFVIGGKEPFYLLIDGGLVGPESRKWKALEEKTGDIPLP